MCSGICRLAGSPRAFQAPRPRADAGISAVCGELAHTYAGGMKQTRRLLMAVEAAVSGETTKVVRIRSPKPAGMGPIPLDSRLIRPIPDAFCPHP